jgi:hypothetical protein
MTSSQRNYNVKDVDMLITVSTIMETAIKNKTLLQSKRSYWADPFFEDLKARVEASIKACLGLDSAKDLRQATLMLYSIQKQAYIVLAEIKIQIMEDFKKDKLRRDEILNQLGFTYLLNNAKRNDQEVLINMLYQFRANLTPELRNEISQKGTNAESLDTVVGFSESLKNANVGQEGFKGERRNLTTEMRIELNAIYDEVITITKIASKFYKDKPNIKDQFSFSKVSKALNASSKSDTESVPKAA